MTLEDIRESIGELSKDVKINISTVLTERGAPGLKLNQIAGAALTCAYSTKNSDLISAIEDSFESLDPNEIRAAQTASILMAMNNIYYRFVHLCEDTEIQNLPAKLRMTAIADPGVDKIDFEIYSLAASILSGCGSCIKAHSQMLKKAGFSSEGIQSIARIASVIHSAAQTLSVKNITDKGAIKTGLELSKNP